jgi:hypothetical protein
MYLAWFPIAPGQPPPRPAEWQLLLALAADGTPRWGTQDDLNETNRNVPGLNARPHELLGPGFVPGLGELSVAWIPTMARWVMTYGSGICRVARTPWGPWSPEVLIFDYNDPTRDAGNSNRGSAPAWARPAGQFVPAQAQENHAVPAPTYAPYIVGRWTQWDGSTRTLSLVHTLSTGPGADMPGYEPQLMRTTLMC